jgi:hypothetical protein
MSESLSSTAVVRVIAPSDLPPGYEFVVNDRHDGQQKLVQVPSEGHGVKAGAQYPHRTLARRPLLVLLAGMLPRSMLLDVLVCVLHPWSSFDSHETFLGWFTTGRDERRQ